MYVPSAVDLRARHLALKPDDKGQWEVSGALGFNILHAKDLQRFGADIDSQSMDAKFQTLWALARETRAQVDEQRPYMDRAQFWVHEMMGMILRNTTDNFMNLNRCAKPAFLLA